MTLISVLLGLPGGWEIAVIVLVVLVLFGGKKIPELMRGMGRGVKEFKDGINGMTDDGDASRSKKEIKD